VPFDPTDVELFTWAFRIQPPWKRQAELAPLICYEAVYPDFAARVMRPQEANYLSPSATKSWFGHSIRPSAKSIYRWPVCERLKVTAG
jgi:apolipoprotein N-acyltransferase